ncbi:hypothetical protein [Sinomicrobium sp.]
MVKYLKFWLRSTNQYGVHSPFVYQFVTQGLYKKGKFRGRKTHRILLRIISYFGIEQLVPTEECSDLQMLLYRYFPHLSERVKGKKRLVYHQLDTGTALGSYFSWKDFDEEDILVVEGIYRSQKSEDSWKEICQHPRVRVTVNLFWLGVVFFRRGQAKEHFVIRP